MTIIINTFSSVKKIFGFSEKQIDMPDRSTVGDVLNKLIQDYCSNNGINSKLFFAVNEEYCDEKKTLDDGDTLAIFPPVSGG